MSGDVRRFEEQTESVSLPVQLTAASAGSGFSFGGPPASAPAPAPPVSRFDSLEESNAADAGEQEDGGKVTMHRVLESGDWPAVGEGARMPQPRRRVDKPLPPPEIKTEQDEECEKFVTKVGADTSALHALLALTPEQRTRLMERGLLGGNVKDPTAVLLSRIREIQRDQGQAPSGPPVCGDFQKYGSCKRGQMCRYRHVVGEDTRLPRSTRPPPPPTQAQAPQQPRPTKPKPNLKHIQCKYFSQGRCTKGDACPFAHEGEGACVPGAGEHANNDEAPRAVPSDNASAPRPPFPAPTDPRMGAPWDPQAQGAGLPPPPPWMGGQGQYRPPPPSYGAREWMPDGAPGPYPPPGSYPQYSPDSGAGWYGAGGWYPQPGPGQYPVEDEQPLTDDEEDQQREGLVADVRDQLAKLVASVPNPKRACLTVGFQLVLGECSERDTDMLLGLEPNAVGLTRFRSVLVKRTLRHAHLEEAVEAVSSLSGWEESLLRWLPPCPRAGPGYARHFEAELCNRVLECCKVMLASPFCRLQLPPGACADAARESGSDPMAAIIRKWAPWASAHSAKEIQGDTFAGLPKPKPVPDTQEPGIAGELGFTMGCGVEWTPAEHDMWPVTFRGRARALARTAFRRGPDGALAKKSVLFNVLSFLPPVYATDIPATDRCPGAHEFLDYAAAVLTNYSVKALSAQTAEEVEAAKQRLGEEMWGSVEAIFGFELAAKMTGMLLQLPPHELLLDLVNTRRFSDALHDAWAVISEADSQTSK
eukprot:Hpha_TRINITY_DN15187_c4_g2::TRINITY_DN15187_c4_g2_i2::g.129429::m.129429